MSMPSVGDLIWCAQMPRECPPYIGWGVRLAVAVAVVVLAVAIALRTLRGRAVICAIWFGVLPWWVYEERPHYTCGYWAHLRLNLRYAWMWATWQETAEDVEFERTVNVRPNWVRGMGRPARIEGEQIVGPHASTYALTEPPRSGIAHEVYVHVHHALRALRTSAAAHLDDEGIRVAQERLSAARSALRVEGPR